MTILRLFSIVLAVAFLSGCGIGDWLGNKKETPPLPGKRIAVLSYGQDVRPDTDNTPAPFAAPAPIANASWPQAGGNPAHVLQNVALSQGALKKVWSSDIGEGARKNLPLTVQPVVAGQSIFTLDTDSVLSAFATDSGKKRWSVSVRDKEEEDPVISGGIAEEGGLLYVTAGYDEILCVEAQKGGIKWRTKLSGPSRAAPTVMSGRVFVTTLDNTLIALSTADGKILWEHAGLPASTGLVGAASAAATQDMVIPAFSSGEIFALRAGNGSVAWSDNLSNALRLGGLSAMSDIRGLPVIDEGAVYAISYGGKMAAIDLNSGARLWQKDIGGSKTPWVSGNRIFLISEDSKIVSLNKQDGAAAWVSQLARYEDAKERKGVLVWTGPIMAGNRLIAVSSDGRVAEIDPAKGSLLREWDSGEGIQISPVVAGGTLYILSNDGDLAAYR